MVLENARYLEACEQDRKEIRNGEQRCKRLRFRIIQSVMDDGTLLDGNGNYILEIMLSFCNERQLRDIEAVVAEFLDEEPEKGWQKLLTEKLGVNSTWRAI